MLKTLTPGHSTAWARPSALRNSLMIAAVSVFLPAAAVAQGGTTGAAAASTHLSTQDMHFLHIAAAAGLSEVQEGQLAQSKGDAAVRKVGAQMVTDHTRINRQLTILAQMKGVTVPGAVTNVQAAQLARLNEMGGAPFDRLYLRDQKRAHEQAIQLFQTEAQSGTDADLRKFASTNLPTLQEHLQMIEAAQKQEATSAS
jgi:putative membrane protein